jgi:NADP-dependent 3-hydroxy acid dehydrogenase YdfG
MDKEKGWPIMGAKRVLLTGATSGIGKALFYQYVRQGHHVIACGRNEQTLNELTSFSSNAQTLAFDVVDQAQIKAHAEQLSELDILILNAGDCLYIDDAKHFDSKAFHHIIDVNLRALGGQLEHFLPKVKCGGQVVFISSSATLLPFPRAEAYGASKAGVDYLANSLRIDLKNDNIEVTLVHPGFIKTPLTDKNTFDMPFLLSSEEAARRIYYGVEARKPYLHFPKRLTYLLKTLAILPNFIWQAIALRSRKA